MTEDERSPRDELTYDEVMQAGLLLAASMEALAVLVGRLALVEHGDDFDPPLQPLVDEVLVRAGITGDVRSLSSSDAHRAGAGLRAFLLQALELADRPRRPPGWAFDDPTVLLAQGQASAGLPAIIDRWCLAELDGLGPALSRPGAAMLDIGCGVAAAAIAACQLWPEVRVLGIDPWPPAVALAQEEITAARLEDRIEVRRIGIEALHVDDEFDLAWVPGPFLPEALLDVALDHAWRALHPGGWAIMGLYGGPDDPLVDAVGRLRTDAVGRLRTVRSGGLLLTAAEARTRLAHHGFAEVREITRVWGAPMRLLAGRRIGGTDQ